MIDEDDEQATPPRRIGRWIAGGAVGVFALGLAVGWSQREPLARNAIDRMLWRNGVDGSYRIARFGVSSQTIEHVSLGDPTAPDLTARRATVHLRYRFGWPSVTRIEAEGVRLRGRIVKGTLSLGSVDRLLPSGGGPFALPDVAVDLRDAAMRLETPVGIAQLSLAGRGNLAGGFRGTLGVAMPVALAAGCRASDVAGRLLFTTAGGEPTLAGPVRSASLACAGATVTAPRLELDATLAKALDGWRGAAGFVTAGVSAGSVRAKAARGRVDFSGTAQATNGAMRVALDEAAVPGGRARRMEFDGGYRFTGGRIEVAGDASLAGGSADARAVRALATAGAGSPAGPALVGLGRAIEAAAGAFGGSARLSLRAGDAPLRLAIERIDLKAASGAALAVRAQGQPEAVIVQGGIPLLHLAGTITGGGLPTTRLLLTGNRSISGRAEVAPFGTADSRVALAPVAFSRAEGGALRFATRLTLDGPVADGRVEGLTLPVAGEAGARGLFVNRQCERLGFARLAIAGTVFRPASLPLCPIGAAMVTPGGGGVRIAGTRILGAVGKAPLVLAFGTIAVPLDRPGFTAQGLTVRLGEGDDPTKLDLPTLDGRFSPAGIAGTFRDASGKIGNVPLLLSGAAGDWTLKGGVLALGGGLTVADAGAPARFEPLVSRDVTLELRGGVITASGHLLEPKTAAEIAAVNLRHDLGKGAGDATLAVGRLLFDDRLQPEALTRLTLGVIANVQGSLTGEGRIRWDANGVSSDGDFATEGVDLAAAFGPVKGIKGRIHFSDLLALATPPGQVATIAEINPGIAVSEGVVRYQLLPEQRVKVEAARWPFSGGELELAPTEMDFGRPVERRMTFRVTGMDAAKFVEQFDFKNIAVTGTFDGSLPMIFDDTGGRIVGGRLTVRKAGGTLAYVGELSNAQLGTFGKLAFDALKSMRYDSLSIGLDGALDGDVVTQVFFDGTNETPKAARRGIMGQFSNLPFRFRITIRAPFRGLLNSASSLNDPRGLIRQALPPAGVLPGSGGASASPTVQPPVSENRR
ncbi:YdbH domain-containing protein [Sphingomonas naphthae]|uniref:YdbH domain-containing protein n=1 Tax=Sphingomonas naphthae TaxID=1813468 RepID=A0ABY7TG55_9SPHN|nr:YdbH domain-containing protein [Sphingomonas naphthae]WCT72124.1 YdbH domain-containing protein [Sphingomonas naphthae]